MTVRPRLLVLGVLLAVAAASALVALARSQSPGCTVSAPRPSLPAQLRALGDFDQAYDPANPAALADAAQRAAAALHGDLIGATAETPVSVSAVSNTAPAALVVPLRARPTPASAAPPLAGLVVFLLDCRGNAYFASVEDDVARQPPPADFPAVARAQAEAELGTDALRLAYASDPLQPEWVTTAPPPHTLPAR